MSGTACSNARRQQVQQELSSKRTTSGLLSSQNSGARGVHAAGNTIYTRQMSNIR